MAINNSRQISNARDFCDAPPVESDLDTLESIAKGIGFSSKRIKDGIQIHHKELADLNDPRFPFGTFCVYESHNKKAKTAVYSTIVKRLARAIELILNEREKNDAPQEE